MMPIPLLLHALFPEFPGWVWFLILAVLASATVGLGALVAGSARRLDGTDTRTTTLYVLVGFFAFGFLLSAIGMGPTGFLLGIPAVITMLLMRRFEREKPLGSFRRRSVTAAILFVLICSSCLSAIAMLAPLID